MKCQLLFVVAVLIYSCSSKPVTPTAPLPPTLPVASLVSVADTTYQEYPAAIEANVNVELRPQVRGILDKVFVDEGAYVKAGDPLFSISKPPFQAALNNALAMQRSSENAAVNASIEIEKLTPLVKNNVVSEVQLKTANAAYEVAKANIEQAKANVDAAKINLGYTLIKAPVSGYIGRLLKKQGSLVSPEDQESLTLLSDVHEVHVYFSLSEKDFVDFKNNHPGRTLNEKLKAIKPVALLLPDNSVYNLPGRIDMVDGQFDKNTGAITMRATFSNTAGLLRSGNTGRIQLSLPFEQALTVPQSATTELQDKTFVFLVTDSNKVKKQFISIAGKSKSNYLVKEGLKAGDRIVLSGFDRLQEGTVITPEKSAAVVSQN